MFISLIVLILLRVPVAFALAFSVVPILIMTPSVTPLMLLHRMMMQFGSFILLAIPFFVLAANLMNWSGITNMLLRLAKAMVGFLPGGLGHVNVVTSMIFAGISGSSNADAAGEGSIIIPAMIKEGYDVNFSVAVTACSAVMGVIIPPSIIMVVWGGVMNVSVSGLIFSPGCFPASSSACSRWPWCSNYAITRKYTREEKFSLFELGPGPSRIDSRDHDPDHQSSAASCSASSPRRKLPWWAVGLRESWASFVYRTWTSMNFLKIVHETMLLCPRWLLFCVGCAAITHGSGLLQEPPVSVEFMGGLTTNRRSCCSSSSALFLVVGMFIRRGPGHHHLAPLLKPVAASVGIHPLHFAIVGCITLAYGLITPPTGLCLLISCQIAKINVVQPIK
jgi:TRAP-type C4-dicarboxylate transport system permease large subunit